MIQIRPLDVLDPADLLRLITGYVSDAKYRVSKTETGEQFALALDLVPLPQPYVKRYEPPDAETLEHYMQVPRHGLSLGAYDAGGLCVGIALANRALGIRVCGCGSSTSRRRIAGEGRG